MKTRMYLLLIWLGLWLVGLLSLVRMAWAIITNTEKAWEIALAFDGLGNVATNGDLGQTVSSRAAYSRPKAWGCILCRLLDKLDPGHCDRAMTAKEQNLECVK